jgi:hypothetical protein
MGSCFSRIEAMPILDFDEPFDQLSMNSIRGWMIQSLWFYKPFNWLRTSSTGVAD